AQAPWPQRSHIATNQPPVMHSHRKLVRTSEQRDLCRFLVCTGEDGGKCVRVCVCVCLLCVSCIVCVCLLCVSCIVCVCLVCELVVGVCLVWGWSVCVSVGWCLRV